MLKNLSDMNNFKHYLIEIYDYRHVLKLLVRQYLVLRYRRTILGYLWTLVNPLLMMGVMAVVFSAVQKIDLKTFAIFLFAGMVPWACFNNMITLSSNSLIVNESLIKKIYIPKVIFPLSVSIGVLIDSMFSFVSLLILIVVLGAEPLLVWLYIPFAFLLLFLFSFGVALIFSILTVFLRDLQYILGVVMQALFFLSPVLYEKGLLKGDMAVIIALNPIVPFIELFRSVLNDGKMPSIDIIQSSLFLAVLSFVIGVIFFFLKQNRIIFRL